MSALFQCVTALACDPSSCDARSLQTQRRSSEPVGVDLRVVAGAGRAFTGAYFPADAGRRDARRGRRGLSALGAGGRARSICTAFSAAQVFDQLTDDRLMQKDARGYWTGYQDGARDGDRYRFWVQGKGSSGYKRDPRARELDPAELSGLLCHPARRRLSLARPGFRHAGFFRHGRLPAPCRDLCDHQSPACARPSSTSR